MVDFVFDGAFGVFDVPHASLAVAGNKGAFDLAFEAAGSSGFQGTGQGRGSESEFHVYSLPFTGFGTAAGVST